APVVLGLLLLAGPGAASGGTRATTPARLVKLSITPGAVSLAGPQSWQTLVVNAAYSDGSVRDVTAETNLSAGKPGIVKVAGRVVKPVADGKAEVVARYRGLRAAVPVTVKDSHERFVWSFRNQVISVLSKAGCNAGACQGAAAGKNGFRLTLLSYDPDLDYQRLLHESGG